jgi:hypothetical protein
MADIERLLAHLPADATFADVDRILANRRRQVELAEILGASAADPADIVDALDPAAVATAFAHRLEMARPAWMTDACSCRRPENAGVDFFAPPQRARPALAVCSSCPVLDPCRAWAIAQPGPDVGVAGGMTAPARVRARRASPS